MLRTPGFFTIVTLVGAGLLACSGTSNNTGPTGTGGQTSGTGASSSTGSSVGGGGSGTGGGTGAGGSGPEFLSCGNTSGALKFGGASSNPTISQDTTWTKDKLYLVLGKLTVEGSSAPATLTVEAGTTICFGRDDTADEEGSITVGPSGAGGLVMKGTATEHIVMTSKDGFNDFYEGIHGGSGYTELSLTYVDIYNASAGFPYSVGAIETTDPATPAVTLDHVTMHRLNAGCGVKLANTSGVTPNSGITISSYPSSGPNQYPAVIIDPVAAGTLPSSFVTLSSPKDVPPEFQVIEFLTNEVNKTVTWHNAGLPYASIKDDFYVRRTGASGASPVLTVADGVTWMLHGQGMVYAGDTNGHPGDIVIGEAGGPKKTLITTRGDKTSTSGYFGTIWFQNFDPKVSKIVNATIEYGGNGSAGVKNCHSPNYPVSPDRGMITLSGTGTYEGPAITNSKFSQTPTGFTCDAILALCDGSDCIAMANDYTLGAAGNTFDHILMGVSQQPTTKCP
jgi:hypothetical protein